MIFHSQFSESEVRQSQVSPASQSRLLCALLRSHVGSRTPRYASHSDFDTTFGLSVALRSRLLFPALEFGRFAVFVREE